MNQSTPAEQSASSTATDHGQISPSQGVLPASALQSLLIVYGLWIAVAAFYWPSTQALNALWTEPTQQEAFTHGYLILFVSLWLTWRERRRLAETPIRPHSLALVPLLLLSILWLWSWRAALQEVHMMLVPLILLAALLAALGPRAVRLLAFPIGYLYFALPFWGDGNFILQSLSARMTGVLLWITGLPGFMHGNFIELPAGTIRIAGGCSGLHSFIVGLALAALYGKLFDLPLRRRISALAVMGCMALVVNWLRILIVTCVAYATDMGSSLVRNHYWLGWWMFAAAFAGFLWWMERNPLPRTTESARENLITAPPAQRTSTSRPSRAGTNTVTLVFVVALLVAVGVGLHLSLTHNYYRHYWIGWSLCVATLTAALGKTGFRHLRRKTQTAAADAPEPLATDSPILERGTGWAHIVATLIALGLLPAASYAMDTAYNNASRTVAIEWPTAPPGWNGPNQIEVSQWHPFFVHADGESLRAYTNSDGQTVQVFAVAYSVQTQHAKLLEYRNRLLGNSQSLRSESQNIVNSPSGRWIETRVTSTSGAHSLIWSRYAVGTRTFVEPRLAQSWYGLMALGSRPISSLSAMRARCESNCHTAHTLLATISDDFQPHYQPANIRP